MKDINALFKKINGPFVADSKIYSVRITEDTVDVFQVNAMNLSEENGSCLYRLSLPLFTSPLTSDYYLKTKDLNFVIRLHCSNVMYTYDKNTAVQFAIKKLKKIIEECHKNECNLPIETVESRIKEYNQKIIAIFYEEWKELSYDL